MRRFCSSPLPKPRPSDIGELGIRIPQQGRCQSVINKQSPDGALRPGEAQPYSPPPIDAIPTVQTLEYPVRYAAQPFVWTEAEEPRRTGGSEWAVYHEVAWHLDRQEITTCISIEICSYQDIDLLLKGVAYEAINLGRQWSVVQRLPYENYQAAKTIALLWLPEAQGHIQRSYLLASRDERVLFRHLIAEEDHLQGEIRKLRFFYTPYPADTRLETMAERVGWFQGPDRRADLARATHVMRLLCEKGLVTECQQEGQFLYHTPEFLHWSSNYQHIGGG
jgi:hypothetical protein